MFQPLTREELNKLLPFCPPTATVIFRDNEGSLFYAQEFKQKATYWNTEDMVPKILHSKIHQCHKVAVLNPKTKQWEMEFNVSDNENTRLSRMRAAQGALTKARTAVPIAELIKKRETSEPSPEQPSIELATEKRKVAPAEQTKVDLTKVNPAVKSGEGLYGTYQQPKDEQKPFVPVTKGVILSDKENAVKLYSFGDLGDDFAPSSLDRYKAGRPHIQHALKIRFTSSGKIILSQGLVSKMGVGTQFELLYNKDLSKMIVQPFPANTLPDLYQVTKSGNINNKDLTQRLQIPEGCISLHYLFVYDENHNYYVGTRSENTKITGE